MRWLCLTLLSSQPVLHEIAFDVLTNQEAAAAQTLIPGDDDFAPSLF